VCRMLGLHYGRVLERLLRVAYPVKWSSGLSHYRYISHAATEGRRGRVSDWARVHKCSMRTQPACWQALVHLPINCALSKS